MRKLVLLLAILASSVFLLAATPNPASAANCTGAHIGAIVYDGTWYFYANITGCTGVNGAALMGYDAGSYTTITDNNTGIVHNTTTLTLTYLGAASFYEWNGPHFNVWGSGCGSPPFSASKRFGWRIRNSSGSTWGKWHQTGSSTQMLC